LAHVASAEGINCVEKIAGIHVAIDYGNVPGCTYVPEIASVGLTENKPEKKDTN
jgi:dihydrolipoamide dehydrogenase